MLIRSFQLSDYRSVSEVLEHVLSEECCAETIEAFARQLSWDSELVLVAEQDGAIVGVLIGTIDGRKGYVYRLAVLPEHRRQGIGRALVDAVGTRFRLRKVSKTLIAKDKHNELLVPFYQTIGVALVDFVTPNRPLAIVAG